MTERNWAGNLVYRAGHIDRPPSLAELQRLVATAPQVRALGSRHSFSDIADAERLVSVDGLPRDIVVDPDAGTVSLTGAVRYGELAPVLRDHGVALANLASLPHISVAGAVATATHGSGDHNRNLAASVAAVEMVTSTGDLVAVARGDDDFDGIVVGLGALGIVTRLTLDVEPAYDVRQTVYEGLSWPALFDHFDEIMGSGHSVSIFTRWGADIDQVWVKERMDGRQGPAPTTLFDASAATVDRHPIRELDPVHCTPQLGLPGSWAERLPHFRMAFTPSNGNELQSELHVGRADAVDAFRTVRALAETIAPALQISELRTVAADHLWMSPQHDADTVAIHFTWVDDPAVAGNALGRVEAALAPFEPRPHWGKLFEATAAELAPRYPRFDEFVALAERLDPRGAFRNAWFERCLIGTS